MKMSFPIKYNGFLYLMTLSLFLIAGNSIGWAQQPQAPKAPNSGTSGNDTTTVSVGADVDKTLAYVNNLLDSYNPFNSSISVNTYAGTIIFSDKFSVFTGKFEDVEFRRDGENMGMFCKGDRDCLKQRDVETGEENPDAMKYTFGIKKGGQAVPETDTAIYWLNQMLDSLTGNRVNDVSLSEGIIANLALINKAFEDYNSYGTVFSVEDKNLRWVSSVTDAYVAFKDLTFYIDYENNWIVLKCINEGCFKGTTFSSEYSMGLETADGTIAPVIENVLQAFNSLRREVLAGR